MWYHIITPLVLLGDVNMVPGVLVRKACVNSQSFLSLARTHGRSHLAPHSPYPSHNFLLKEERGKRSLDPPAR